MSYANMDGVPTQTAGTSEILASDWNTYVRDNFDSIKFGHVLTDVEANLPSGVGEGTMAYATTDDKLFLYEDAGWKLIVSNGAPVMG